MPGIKITLVAFDSRSAQVAQDGADRIRDVEYHFGDICEVDATHFVSPANSYGFMDGGIDQRFRNYYDPTDIQFLVRERIKKHWNGYLPVGAADAVELPKADDRPHLIVAPTMPAPMVVAETPNAYLATKAALYVARNVSFRAPVHLAIPAMCNGVGQMPARRCWAQIRLAINEHRDGRPLMHVSTAEARAFVQTLGRL